MMEELTEVEGTISTPRSWARIGNGRWHEVKHISVYMYATKDGGYDTILNVITRCHQAIRVDSVQMAITEPECTCVACGVIA